MIKIKKAVICLTEDTLRQLLTLVKEGKEKTSFTNAPFPDGDMSNDTWIKHKRIRGLFTIEAPSDGISFEIKVKHPSKCRNEESILYKMNYGEEK